MLRMSSVRTSVEPVAAAVWRVARELRTKRGWSAAQLSEECAKVGYPISRSAIANADSGRRDKMSVDELVGLATVFNVEAAHLLFGEISLCMTCHGTPPVGFICATCMTRRTTDDPSPELVALIKVIASAKLDGVKTVQDLAQAILNAGYQAQS